MGMFDEIETNKPCLKCGKNMETMQTKATLCMCHTYKIGDPILFDGATVSNGNFEVHGYCESCKYWHDGVAVIKDGKLLEVTNLVLGHEIK